MINKLHSICTFEQDKFLKARMGVFVIVLQDDERNDKVSS